MGFKKKGIQMKKETWTFDNKQANRSPHTFRYWNRLTVLGVVIFVAVMLAAGLVTAAIFLILNAVGVLKGIDISLIGILLIAISASIIIGVILAIVFSNLFIRPFDELISAMRIVSGGDFSVRVRERGKNHPMGRLSRNFNEMLDELSGIELFRRDFINTFSHELKTPIVSIRGFARQLRDGDPTPEEQREYAGIIIAESDRLTNMASNILLLSKLENQNAVTDRAPFSLDEQLRHCLLLFEKEWSAKELDLSVELDEVSVTSNEEMLSHVWINLISNAVKFTPAGGAVSVSLTREYGCVRVEVSDTGCGMDAETRKRIFDKFYQGDLSRSAEGNGLGLSVAARVVELLGGTISVESAPGVGSSFTVVLPGEAGADVRE